MKRRPGVLVVIAAAVSLAVPQDQAGSRRSIAGLVEHREHSSAVAALLAEKAADPKRFAAGDREYLLAREAESDGLLGQAMNSYQNVIHQGSRLSLYALAHLSRLGRSSGNLPLERLCLQRLKGSYPVSSFAGSARYWLARNAIETENFAEAIRILTLRESRPSPLPVDKRKQAGFARELRGLLGEAYSLSGSALDARAIFAALLDGTPNPAQPDDQDVAAVRYLDKLDAGSELSDSEHYRRAGVYQFNRDFEDARKHYEAVVGSASASAADAGLQIGRGYAQSDDDVNALQWFERILEQFPDSASAKDALLQAAAAYGRVGKPKEAITRYQHFIERYPADEKLDRAYLNIVDLHRDQGGDQDALKWCDKAEAALKGKPGEPAAVFAKARIYLARDEWPQALTQIEKLQGFSDLGGPVIPGSTDHREAAFLRGLLLERSKRYAEAIEVYVSIPEGRNEYYGWRATESLKELSTNEAAATLVAGKIASLAAALDSKDAKLRRESAATLLRLNISPEQRKRATAVFADEVKGLPLSRDRDQKPADTTSNSGEKSGIRALLIDLGLYDDAVMELESGADRRSSMSEFIRGDRADRSLAVTEPQWNKVAADLPIEALPRKELESLYPVVYSDLLLKYSAESGVDPRLLLAIIRQESRFQPDARSNAAARGLMQFISTTSAPLAARLNVRGFSDDDLYDPSTSIRFGSRYVADLFALFPEQTQAVVASYNGGDDNMKRWIGRARSNMPDRYVPEIRFTQTKDYVYRVMCNFRMYKMLYDENLRPIA